MSRKFLTALDLAKNELQNGTIQNLASDPGSPTTGQFYFNTGTKRIRTYNGATWDEYGTGGGSGDVSSNTASSVDSEIALFNGTTGKSIKRATGTGIAKVTSGVFSTATSGTDYSAGTSALATGILKSTTTTGALTIAAAGTDYYNPGGTDVAIADGGTGASTLPTGALKGNGTSAITQATINDLGATTADFSMSSHKLTNVTDPSSAQDAATKNYVDLARQGLSVKDPVRVATTANGTLASAFANGSSVDGVTLATGDRILLKNQSTASENGIYTVNASGAPTRATDADASGELQAGTFLLVVAGTANAGQQFTVQSTTATPWVPNSSGSTWVQISGASTITAGAGLTATGNVFAVGAGTGISVGTDTVTVDRSTNGATVPFKYIATIGDGSTTAIAVTHSMGTSDVVTSVRDASTNAQVECDVTHTSSSVVTFTFAVAPATNAYKVVIIG